MPITFFGSGEAALV